MHQKTSKGLFGVLGVWLTAGLALPFVNVLDMFTVPQLMVFRGFLTALMAFVILHGRIGKVDKCTFAIAFVLPCATLGLYNGIRLWGAGPTIIIICATPVINLIIGFFLGRKVSLASIIGFIFVIGGVVLANKGGEFKWDGFLWATFAMIMNGILYELFARAKAKPLQKCFYACMGMGTLGLVLSLKADWPQVFQFHVAFMVVGFAFVGGLLYWLSNLVAFENLPTVDASVLVQGETPAVIIGAAILLGERFTFSQWMGVIVALVGACYLSYWLAKQK